MCDVPIVVHRKIQCDKLPLRGKFSQRICHMDDNWHNLHKIILNLIVVWHILKCEWMIDSLDVCLYWYEKDIKSINIKCCYNQ